MNLQWHHHGVGLQNTVNFDLGSQGGLVAVDLAGLVAPGEDHYRLQDPSEAVGPYVQRTLAAISD